MSSAKKLTSPAAERRSYNGGVAVVPPLSWRKGILCKIAAMPVVCGLALFLGVFLIYLSTAPRTIFGLDSAELSAGSYCLGIVHSPGSPLYMLVGHAFSLIPFGDIGFRLNLMSVVFASACVGLHYLIGLRLTGRPLPAAVGALAVAFCYYFWAWAIVAELYAPHSFFVLLVFWLILKGRETMRVFWIGAAGLAFGLGMGNHTALSLMAPAYAWLVLSAPMKWHTKISAALLAGLGGVLGLSVYLYFPLRHAAQPAVDYVRDYFPTIDLSSPAGLWWMFRGGMFESLFFSVPLSGVVTSLAQHLMQLIEGFTPAGLLLAVGGCVRLFRVHRALQVGLALMFLFHVGFFSTYGALDRKWMYSVSYLVVGLWLGVGLAGVLVATGVRWPAGRRWIVVGVSMLLSVQVMNGYRVLDLRSDTSARDYGEWVFTYLPKNCVFFGLWEQIPILEYLQVVEGRRADVKLANVVFLRNEQVLDLIQQAPQGGVFASRPLEYMYAARWVPQAIARWTIFHLER